MTNQMESNVAVGSAGDVGIVVIGRNEAARLGACLEPLCAGASALVYVDSGSIDGSAAVVQDLGVTTIRLNEGPYTAARGRQVGFEALSARHPNLKYIQFVDGDCILHPQWIKCAAAFLESNVRAAAVVGRLRERHADDSSLIWLVNVDWDLPTGEVDAIGGISMVRLAALRDVGGWRTTLIAGEELDLSARLRARGWRLLRLPEDMAVHDIGIRSVRELWRRSVRSGFAYSQLAFLHGWRRCRRWLRRAVGNVVYGALLPTLFAILLAVWWPGSVLTAAIYVLLLCRVVRARIRRHDPPGLAVLYALWVLGQKVPAAVGTFRFLALRVSQRQSQLIEYKAVSSEEG
jgi:GT2 family glycosyltransferase